MLSNIKNFFNNLSIFYKIAFITITITSLLSIASNFLLFSHFSENLMDKNRLLIQEATNRIRDLMQDKYNMMYNQQTLIHSTDYIASVITTTRSNPSSIYKQDSLSKITDYINALKYSDADILETILFTADGENAFSSTPTTGRKATLSYPYMSIPYIRDFEQSNSNITVIYDSMPPYLSDTKEEASKGVISFLAKIYDTSQPSKGIPVGYLLINIAPKTLISAYQDLDTASEGSYLVINSDSQIVWSNVSSYIGQTYKQNLIPFENILQRDSISLSGITVIGSISERTLKESTTDIIRYTLLVTELELFCLIIAVILLHKYYSKKFKLITTAMSQIGTGDFSVTLPETSNDEIGELIHAFNMMQHTLDTYIKKNYLAETQRRSAELYALQAQINPHFLNNTIESIRMKALNSGDYEVSEMLAHFGALFRCMIQFNEDIIYIEDEVDYIDSYLELQKFRFEDRVSVQIDVPPEILYLGIPRFTLQPIVENTLSHAFETSDKTLHISILFTHADNNLLLTVSDNGNGIPEDLLKKLRLHIDGKSTFPEFGIALRNIHTRIRLLFGTPYGLSIHSTEHLGTTIEVLLPIINKEETEKNV